MNIASPLNAAPMLERSPTAAKYADFHESALFLGVWLLVLFVGVHTLTAMRTILEPLLWAFFFTMALNPIADCLEVLFQKYICCCGQTQRRRRQARGARTVASSDEEIISESSDDETAVCLQRSARPLAVVCVVCLFMIVIFLVGVLVYQSAEHMKNDWQYYVDGADKINLQIAEWKELVPQELLSQIVNKGLSSVEEVLSVLLGTVVDVVSELLFGFVMTLLYVLFWLCAPIQISAKVSGVFKHYILLKSVASGLYAFCIWLLLHFLDVDLAIVFGILTFFFNFVPEIGPFFAMVLPLPVILFDGRLDRPVFVFLSAIVGQLILKFIFGNVVEVKLVERDQSMRMHPVVILFFVAFFGWMWGATGMLLSVPIMAAAKTTISAVPKQYRDPILILLEGDVQSPARYDEYIESQEKKE